MVMQSRALVVVYVDDLRKSRSDALEVKFKAEASTDMYCTFLQVLGKSEVGRGPSVLMR